MINQDRLREHYLNWLLEIVCSPQQILEYGFLWNLLYQTDFVYNEANRDINRAKKGLELRQNYILDEYYLDEFEEKPCSVLEMLIALSCDIDSVAGDIREGDCSGEFFWIMLRNLKLADKTNEIFDPEEVSERLDDWMHGYFDRNGSGSPFILTKCRKNVREMEIWEAACQWMNEFLGLI